MRQRLSGVLLLVSMLLSSGAAVYADGGGTATPMPPQVTPGFIDPSITGVVRVIHASPGTPNLDIYLSGMAAPIITNLGYGTATGFLTIPSATYVMTIRLAGSPVTSAPLFSHTMVLSPDSSLNVIAIGLLTRQNSRGFLLMFVPANRDPSRWKYARVQVIHASPSYGTVNVLVNGNIAVQDLLYGDGLFTGIDFVPGAYTLTLMQSKNDTTVTVLNLPNMGLNANTLYTVLDYGLADGIHSMVLVDPLKAFVPLAPVATPAG